MFNKRIGNASVGISLGACKVQEERDNHCTAAMLQGPASACLEIVPERAPMQPWRAQSHFKVYHRNMKVCRRMKT